MLFPQRLRRVTFPPAVRRVQLIHIPAHTCSFSLCFIRSIPTGVTWWLTVL